MRKLTLMVPFLLLALAASAFAADTVLTWPASGADLMLRFTVGKLRKINSVSNQSDFLGDALAENLSAKTIPSASFYLYLLDKNGKRVGEGYLEVSNLAAGQKAKVPVSVHAMDSFVSMELQPQHLPTDEPMKVKMSVTSVPAGASLKLDLQDAGITPQMLAMAPGKHSVEFSKEGYATESTPVDIAENSPPGSLKLELNPLTVDTVVLRDGTVLLGNVTAVTTTGVAISLKGKPTKIDRAQVARVVFGAKAASNTAMKSTPRHKK